MENLKFDQLLVSSLNNKDKKLDLESFTYRTIFLSSVIPDETNARFLPVKFISDEDAKFFVERKITKNHLSKSYDAENHVMIGKSCIINCLKYDSINWRKANQTIESIVELGDNISVSELIQASTIYPVGDDKYQVLTGHRRYFALVYAKGYDSAAQFKVYDKRPLLIKIKQFQENASREDLPQYGKLTAFGNAIMEIEALNSARIKVGLKKLTVKETSVSLGISMGAFDNYNVLVRYPCIIDAYESGLSFSFVKTKKIVLQSELEYKSEHNKSVLNVTDRKKISKILESKIFDSKLPRLPNHTYNIKPVKSSQTIKTLLTVDIRSLDTGIVWSDVDWEDEVMVSQTLAFIIDFLEN